ncbi:MAG: CocE/NonD family hydrolase [Acidobacteriota bacterium]
MALAVAAAGTGALQPLPAVGVEKNVPAAMRDGVVLRADVYRPPGGSLAPALLQRTPYSKSDAATARRARELAARGYVVVVQDTRGRYTSDGVAVPHVEAEDGYDTVQWAAALPGVDGRVGMFGGSYLATTQLQAASLAPPALVALFPASSYSRRHDMAFQGGAFYLSDGLGWNLGQAMDVRRRMLTPDADRDGPIGLDAEQRRRLRADWLWRLPLKSINELDLRRFAPGYFEMLDHPDQDAFWAPSDIEARHAHVRVPAFHLTGWYDTLLTGTLRNFAGLRARAATDVARQGQRLIVGPWTHARPSPASTSIDEVDFGPDAGFDADAAMVRWFDRWFNRGAGAAADEGAAPVRLFVMGENRWRDEQEWPLARAVATPFYLGSGGRANTLAGDGRLTTTPPAAGAPPDVFLYDPANPVPSGDAGGYSRAPMDRRTLEARPDILVYTSPPLDADLEVTGPVALTLWIASDARDTDFTGMLVDVHPDGTARALTDGILRARYREGKTRQRLLTPGEPVELTLDLGATANLFKRGHRIRLEVSSSNFPRFDRNPNTGGVFGEDATVRSARQTVFHDAARPSRLVLPVVPRTEAPTASVERRFLDGVSTDAISRIHRQVTEHPHVAGTPRSLQVADRIRQALDAAGLTTDVHDYQAYLSTPAHVAVELTAPVAEPLAVREPDHALDPDSRHPDLGPAYVAYSASGTVTAPVVYVNYGLPPDYAALAAAGVDVTGKIVLARYARSHRAVKIFTAQEAGAAGILIYSDPADDGAARGPVWPEGPWRADFQTQSGNGKYSWHWHGDPLTPGVAATADAPRLRAAEAPTLPRIPAAVLPAREAAKILSRLDGAIAPAAFTGGFAFPYRVGAGAVVVKLDVRMDAGLRTIRNVVGRIEGRRRDRWVVVGTHHDAWTFGGMDPGTGLATVFEVARGLAALRKQGWTPERSIVFAFWDAEEFGLVGSTEYAEAFERDLREKAVVYINTDLTMRGRFDGGGTPTLRDFLVEVTKAVPHFDGGTVYERWRADEWARQPAARKAQGDAGFEVDLAALGSGADFVAFQDYLGLPTLQAEFDFEGSYGAYHSNYDTRQYVERHVDPGFAVTATLSRVIGLAVLRLASADVLPLRYAYYASSIERFLDEARQAAGGRPLDLARARALASAARTRAARLEAALDAARAAGRAGAADYAPINDGLARLEQALLDERDPPAERWYRHVIYGWDIYSLYAGQALPGLTIALRGGDGAAIAREASRVEQALERFVAGLARLEALAAKLPR